MCKEFFKPTWGKLITVLILSSLAILLYIPIGHYFGISTWGRIAFSLYGMISPFDFMVRIFLTQEEILAIGWNARVGIVIAQNAATLAWQYFLACGIMHVYNRATCKKKKAVIITPKKRKKKTRSSK